MHPEYGAGTAHPTYDPAASLVRARGLVRRLTPDAGVLCGLDLDVHAGEVVALVGPRGSGRGTLLRALAGLDRDVVAEGSLRVPATVALLGEDPDLRPWKRVLEGLTASLAPVLGSDARLRARRALAEVGLIDLEEAWTGDLSPADQHRVALARALALGAELILLADPYRCLDALGQRTLHRAVREAAARRGLAVVAVANDPHEAILLADRVLCLAEGRVAEELVVRTDGAVPVAEAYAALHRRLLAAIGIGAPTGREHAAGRVGRLDLRPGVGVRAQETA